MSDSWPAGGYPGSSWGSPRWVHSPGAPGLKAPRCEGPGIPEHHSNGAACTVWRRRWCWSCTFHTELHTLSFHSTSGPRLFYTCRGSRESGWLAPGQKDSQGDFFLIFNLVTKGNVTLLYLRKWTFSNNYITALRNFSVSCPFFNG